MWIRNKRRNNTLAGCLLLSLLQWLELCLGDVLKGGGGIELATVSPLLSVAKSAVVSDVSSDFEQLIEAKLNESASGIKPTENLLSRKRRYLLFPEGSSFQFVFDEYICVVDHTNYLVLGLTVALAWELPSKAPSEAVDDLLNKLESGTIDVSRNDTVSNITYVDDASKPEQDTQQSSNKDNDNSSYKHNYIDLSNKGVGNQPYNSYYSSSPVFRTPMHPLHLYRDSYYRRPNVPARRKDNYYYSSNSSPVRNPFDDWSQPYSPAEKTRFPYWALAAHLEDILRHRNSFYNRDKNQHENVYYGKPKPQRIRKLPRVSSQARHFKIYPVFGKRSIPDAENPHHRHRRSGTSSTHDSNLSRLESHQIKYHRNSRQTLYERIEKYLNKRGVNGHQCVLRSLCETGQKSNEREPGSFAGELIRAVFTIPEALDHEPVAYRDTLYDKAHAHDGDCAALYPECKQSLWDVPFLQ
ncbi:uncharacterized protein LOC133837896 [Drosophila sulfurigaster albostrigata]|uniref:uncharacterized protein LOC133837896 n=1 Tax=Drosophila sulfurigaster albostrigata TaxID=89887 RepID=UPI002D21DDC6|nr:uncharacterized protein LOC133837896 [Drosophila sulfurigaster albostrigata]